LPSEWSDNSVLFACPLENTTQFEEAIVSEQLCAWKGLKTVRKRKDYDFSHNGVPVFEFSSEKLIEQLRGIDLTEVEQNVAEDIFTLLHALEAERKQWKDIQHAMSKGQCRVVLRWKESEVSTPLPRRKSQRIQGRYNEMARVDL
jgi:hypothetical protein